jgi:hypothetical protein
MPSETSAGIMGGVPPLRRKAGRMAGKEWNSPFRHTGRGSDARAGCQKAAKLLDEAVFSKLICK